MRIPISNGVWPTMLTPFTDLNKIDYTALGQMVEWYLKNQVSGLFAVCQSSEMFYLSLSERLQIASFIRKKTDRRVPVIASGHISVNLEDQIYELKAMVDTGVDAVVLVSNRLANQGESDDIWKKNVESVLKEIPDIPLGFYECPYPYKRLISSDLLEWCSETGRFYFLKDTSCNLEEIKTKIKAVEGRDLKIFNANTETLLGSLKFGVAGYSGVMANFFPELLVWLTRNWTRKPDRLKELYKFLKVASSAFESQLYPLNAKYYMQLDGVKILLNSRIKKASQFTSSQKKKVKQFYALSSKYKKKYHLVSYN